MSVTNSLDPGGSPINSIELERIWAWNHVVPRVIDRCVHGMIEEHVSARPEAPAVCAWDGAMSYYELAGVSTSLAHHLIGLSVRPGAFVPLMFEKSMWTIVAMLAILKAGAAFVLLDISLPEDRLRRIVQQTSASVVASSRKNESLARRMVSQVVVVDPQNMKDVAAFDVEQELPQCDPSAPMYVAFTSGSTGTPKGAIVTHRNLASALVHQRDSLQVTPQSRVYDYCSYSFDVSICNIFATLEAGGCVCVPNEEDRHNRLAESIASLGANRIDMTPSVARLLSPEDVPGIQTIVFGGEALRMKDVERWWGKVAIISLYGPCECTPNSTFVEATATAQSMTTMGRGVGLVTWVVDPEDHNLLVPIGESGELLLEGPLVCRGYLDNPSQTAKSFIEDPRWLVEGTPTHPGRRGRVYKTGDMVRQEQDGNLVFMGRKDTQVKVRGQRIELGEIENALRAGSRVDEATAVVHKDDRGEDHIVGFITIRNDHLVSGYEKQNKVERHLDEWEKQFDDDYRCFDDFKDGELGRDFMGWTSMYDGNQIDKAEMNEWLDDTISTITKGHPPQHVLEIGTGSGMILFNLINNLQSYIGLEPSAQAVNFVGKALQTTPTLAGKATVIKGTASDITRVKLTNPPDIVIVNSVAQYFPSQSYLLRVIEDILQIAGVKTIFFGDIRSYALYQEFLAARALHIAAEGRKSKGEVRRIMLDLQRAESELLVDPIFFTDLQTRIPDRIHHVEILPKTMYATNELSAYRYAAILHIKNDQHLSEPISEIDHGQWIDFSREGLDYEALCNRLGSETTSQIMPVSNIPHRKHAFESAVVQLLDSNEVGKNEDPQAWLMTASKVALSKPSLAAMDLDEIAAKSGFKVQVSWARQGFSHGLDAVFYRTTAIEVEQKRPRFFRFPFAQADQSLYELCNAPLQSPSQQVIEDDLLKKLRLTLPPYMIPRALIIMETWPLTLNGKIDRKRLVAHAAEANQGHHGRVRAPGASGQKDPLDPVSEVERRVRAIWSRVLQLDSASIKSNDTFFDLGGSSIDVIKLIQIMKKEGLAMNAASMFRHPKLCDVVRYIKA